MADNSILFADLSSNNGPPNLAKHYKAGHRILALKATEGTSYLWEQHAALADEWHRLGGSVWHYHFGQSGSAAAQADWFLAALLRHLGPDDRLVLDAETGGVGGAFVKAFLGRVHTQHPNHGLLVYGGSYFLRDNHVRPVHGAGLWLAGYPSYAFIPPGWSEVTAHQFTDAAQLPGIPGRVDCSKLLRPAPVPSPGPTPPAKTKPYNALHTVLLRRATTVMRRRAQHGPALNQAARALTSELVDAAHAVEATK